MKVVVALLIAASLLLSACGTSKPQPNPTAAVWNSAKWDSGEWQG